MYSSVERCVQMAG